MFKGNKPVFSNKQKTICGLVGIQVVQREVKEKIFKDHIKLGR